ncbi:MAG: hypothetical protein ABSD21_01895 [Rhizomicrobium sp.]
MNLDPKLLIAGLCILAISFALALIQKQLRQRRLQAAIAPRPQAMAGAKLLADFDNSKARFEGNGAKTIVIVHDFDNPNAYENHRREYLSAREAFEVLAEIRSVDKNTPINIVLHTPGGDRFAGELIAHALKDRANTTAYVPYCAMSAGTTIALATEKVVMGRYASLGPTDAQFGGFPADTFARLLKEKPIQHISDLWLMASFVVEKDLKSAKQRACELLNKKHFQNPDMCALTDFLVSGDLPHGERIGRARAAEFGVNVAKEDCPDEVYRMVETRLELLKTMNGSSGANPDFSSKAPR